MTPDMGRKPGGNATLGELYAAFAAGALPGRLPERRKARLYRGHARLPGAKLLRDGCGRKRYRRRVRINGRKVAVVTRTAP